MKNTFGIPIIPANEEERLKAVKSYAILYDMPDKYLNDTAAIIAKTFNAPIALISIVESSHVQFKGNFGMEETSKVERGVSLCSLAILRDAPTIFQNATIEPCLLANPLVAGEFGLKFYAGVPLTTKEGLHIGTVCIVDKEPRIIEEAEIELLSEFATNVMQELEHRKFIQTGTKE